MCVAAFDLVNENSGNFRYALVDERTGRDVVAGPEGQTLLDGRALRIDGIWTIMLHTPCYTVRDFECSDSDPGAPEPVPGSEWSTWRDGEFVPGGVGSPSEPAGN